MKPIQNESSIFWKTPPELIEEYTEEFGELFDPCPSNPDFDGLEIRWPANRAVFVNPPYARGQLSKWVQKCFSEWFRTGQTVILLIPPYTDTAYFHEWILPWCEIRFLRFNDGSVGRPGPAPFPSIVCIYPGGQTSEYERMDATKNNAYRARLSYEQ